MDEQTTEQTAAPAGTQAVAAPAQPLQLDIWLPGSLIDRRTQTVRGFAGKVNAKGNRYAMRVASPKDTAKANGMVLNKTTRPQVEKLRLDAQDAAMAKVRGWINEQGDGITLESMAVTDRKSGVRATTVTFVEVERPDEIMTGLNAMLAKGQLDQQQYDAMVARHLAQKARATVNVTSTVTTGEAAPAPVTPKVETTVTDGAGV